MGADTNAFYLPVNNRPDPLQIWQPAPTGMIICMTYVATGDRAFTTYFTYLRHFQNLSLIVGDI